MFITPCWLLPEMKYGLQTSYEAGIINNEQDKK